MTIDCKEKKCERRKDCENAGTPCAARLHQLKGLPMSAMDCQPCAIRVSRSEAPKIEGCSERLTNYKNKGTGACEEKTVGLCAIVQRYVQQPDDFFIGEIRPVAFDPSDDEDLSDDKGKDTEAHELQLGFAEAKYADLISELYPDYSKSAKGGKRQRRHLFNEEAARKEAQKRGYKYKEPNTRKSRQDRRMKMTWNQLLERWLLRPGHRGPLGNEEIMDLLRKDGFENVYTGFTRKARHGGRAAFIWAIKNEILYHAIKLTHEGKMTNQQLERLWDRLIFGMKDNDIAKESGVSRVAVTKSIGRAIRHAILDIRSAIRTFRR